MATSLKNIGYILVAFSLVLIIFLIFIKADNDKKGEFLCTEFSEQGLDMNQCPAHTSNISWIITSAFGVAFFIFGLGAYLIFIPKINPEALKKEFKQIDPSRLDEEERKIYELIKNKGGSIYQTDLIKETNFTKVKVSRLLDRLEAKDILERKRRGMTNIVVLK